MKRILAGIVIILLLVIVVFAVIFTVAGRDVAPPDTSDLVLKRVDLADEENAYTWFIAATNHLYWPTNAEPVLDYLDGKPTDDAVVQDVVSRNAKAVEQIALGCRRNACQAPEITGFDTVLPYLMPWRNLGRAMAVQARWERLHSNHGAATDTCILLLQFADRIHYDADCVINYLVGIAIMDLGLKQVRDLARDPATPSGDMAKLSNALGELRAFDHGIVRGIKTEFRLADRTINQIRDGTVDTTLLTGQAREEADSVLKSARSLGYFYQPNKTKTVFAEFYRGMISNAPLCYAEMDLSGSGEDRVFQGGRAHMITRPNGVGRMLLGLLIPALERILDTKCRMECTLAATRLVVACNGVARQRGSLPESLGELVPGLLAQVPADSFDGEPFRYDAQSGIVYSVGRDLEDGGGSTNAPESTHEDPRAKRWEAKDAVFRLLREETR